MAKPVGWKEDSQDTRWNSLGLLDEHIKSLKRQVEVLAQELRSAVAERDQLLNELGVLQWPGLERDARFLLKLPGSVRKGNSAEWRSDARNGRCESQDGEDGTGEESSCKQVHRRGQSWNGWENKNSKNAQQGKPGGKICRSRIKSFDSALGMDNLPFGGDLPTHRGPAPAFDAVLGATNSSVEGQGSRDPREWGVNTVSNTRILSSISEADDELTSEREDNRDPSVQTPPPDSPSTQTGSDPDGDLELPSEDPLVDPELCEATVQEDPSAPRRWLSNSAFRCNFTDSPVPPAESEDPPEAGFAAHHPHVRMRTTHVALVERANRASRLSKELFQAKFALHDSKSQLHFLTERMKMYKNNFQEEVRRHEEEVQKLKGMLNDATTAKFIMFCKLSECQEKVQQLEENLVVSRAMSGNACSGMDENIDQSNKAAFNQSVLEKVDSARSPPVVQARVRGSSMSTIERGVGKLDQTAVGSNFQRRLTETMRRLLEAQSRGDQLQQRLQELEAQLKKGGEDTRSVLSSDWSSGSCSQNRVSHNRTWSDLKQTRVELKRTRLQLHKCEEELNTSNKIRHQQESDLRKLRLELKEAKRRRPPKWR